MRLPRHEDHGMKTLGTLRTSLRRQWHNAGTREARLLDTGQWPLILNIGKPTATQVTGELAVVREHIGQWRRVGVGEVRWQAVNYRGLAETVELPLSWVLHSADEWVAAMVDAQVAREYRLIVAVIDAVVPLFRPMLVRQRQQWLSRGAAETIQACEVAATLEPGCANGRPLRALSVAGCDSKFFERNRPLLTRLLALRFGEAVGEQGLEGFLGAPNEGEHWLLVVPLGAGLLPFDQLRLRSSELRRTALPGSRLLVVENERSLYQLPALADTVAVLGAGLNLSWMQADWLAARSLAYWGDLDTWGLSMLATARLHQPGISALLMDQATFDVLAPDYAVVEPVAAGANPPQGLDSGEQALYRRLLASPRGRLEQEFVPMARVQRAISGWLGG